MRIIPDEPFRFLETYLVRNLGNSKKSPVKTGEGVRAASDSDRVEISDAAREIHLLTRLVPSAPGVNMERVQEVSGKVARGYSVRGDQVAEGLLRSALMDRVL